MRLEFADVSTSYLPDSDLTLLESGKTPLHMAAMDSGDGSLFVVPETPEVLADMTNQCVEAGLSRAFCRILAELSEQGVYYVLFSQEGGSFVCSEQSKCAACPWSALECKKRPSGCLNTPLGKLMMATKLVCDPLHSMQPSMA